MSIKAEISRWIVETCLSGDGRGFAEDVDLLQNGVLDSFGVLSLIAFLEQRYRIRIDTESLDADTFRSVNHMEQMVRSRLPAGTAAK